MRKFLAARHGMKAWLLRLMAMLFSLLPPRAHPSVAKPLAFLLWRTSRRLREVSLINLRLCMPSLTESERSRTAKAAMQHYVRIALETGLAWYWSEPRLDRVFLEPAGMHHLREARAHGRGAILLAPHQGNWEMFNHQLVKEFDGAAGLYKSGEDSGLERLLLEKRGRFGLRMVPADRSGLKAIYQLLAEGKTVFILPDQEPRLGNGRFAPFFGVPALTGVLVPRLIRRTGARAVFGVCLRYPRGRYRVHILPAPEAIYADDLDRAVAAVNRGVERCIAIDPAQYLWAYKRLRTRPDGEERFY